MNQLPPACLLFLSSLVLATAGPLDDAIVSTVRLSDVANYSWTTTIADDARTYDIDGKTVRGAFTSVRMPVVNSIRRKLGRGVTDPQVTAIFRGNVDCVLLTDNGWMRPDELREPSSEPTEPDPLPTLAGTAVLRATPSRLPLLTREKKEPQPYSNLQLAISHPHEELGIIVSSHESFDVVGDLVSGTLTRVGAQLLLVRDGQSEIIPIHAGGTFTLWLRGGMVSRYQVKLEGVLSVQTPRGRAHVAVQQSALTQIQQVGTTTFEVPMTAQAKLLQ